MNALRHEVSLMYCSVDIDNISLHTKDFYVIQNEDLSVIIRFGF